MLAMIPYAKTVKKLRHHPAQHTEQQLGRSHPYGPQHEPTMIPALQNISSIANGN